MSGICGIWRNDHSNSAMEALASMTAGLTLAPAERSAQRCSPGAGIGVSALFSSQQIYQDGRLLLACDAELINEGELAATIGNSVEFPRDNRTAFLIAALYNRHGSKFVEKLRGGFSVILWDSREQRFIAAIDQFGIKRLVYYRGKDTVLAATRIDALVRSGGLELDVNPKGVANVLNFTSNLGPETIFSRVERLIPGAMLVVTDGDTRVEKYWDMRYGVGSDSNETRLSRQLEELMEQSVADHCKNDPWPELGAFLSGGTDSSTVVGLMTRRAPAVKAFSIGFEEQRFNELEYAKLAARKFGSEHYTYLVSARDCFEALPSIIRCFDEPYANSSAVPTYFCARLAAQNGVKTLLAGDGGDELFGGNERYATDKIFQVYGSLPGFLRSGLIEPILAATPFRGGLFGKARRYVARANMPGVERLLSYQFLRTHPLTEIFEGDFLKTLQGYSVVEIPAQHYSRAAAQDHLDRLLYVDVRMTLADNDLPKVTCMSELAGIQVRFPYLDLSVAEFSGRIPAHLKVKRFDKRYLFKRAFRDLLPSEIIHKKKHGFGIPVSSWIKSDPKLRALSRDVLLSARSFNRGYFRRPFIEDLFRKHESDTTSYYGDILWTFLTLELWHRDVVDAPARMTA